MTALSTFPSLTRTGDHASRPAASAVAEGTIYSCTTHGLVYQSIASVWGTWLTAGTPADILDIPTAETDTSLLLAPDGVGGVEFVTAPTGVTDHGALTGLGDDDHTQYIKDTEFGGKGRILVGTASGTFDDLVPGTDGQMLYADSGEATGLLWDDPPTGSSGLAYDSEINLSGGSSATIDHTSIPGTGKTLVLDAVLRGAKSAAFDDLYLNINNDSGANYDLQRQSAFQTTNAAAETIGATAVGIIGQPAAASATAGLFSFYRLIIPFYADTNIRKVIYLQASEITANSSGSILVRHEAWFWRSTAAITQLTWSFAGGNVAQFSRSAYYLIN